jgi:hypothetical protein
LLKEVAQLGVRFKPPVGAPRRKKVISTFVIAATVFFAQSIQSTAPEYGSLREVASAKRVYVHAPDYADRERIVKVLSKDRAFEVVGKPEEADFAILYSTEGAETGFAEFFNVVIRTGIEIGDFVVVKAGDKTAEGESPRPRILWAAKKKKAGGSAFVKTKSPAEELAKQFLKEIAKART